MGLFFYSLLLGRGGVGGGSLCSSPLLYKTENMKSRIAADTKITSIEYSDLEAMCFTSIMSQIPRIANTVKKIVNIASKIEMPFLNIVVVFWFIQI